MRKVEVVSYREEWACMFKEEANKLSRVFKNELITIHHIGSTSIKGLKAKPIIDIMPVVKDINKVDHFNSEMTDLGYEILGENGISGRRYFQKGGNNRSHHVHIYEYQNPEIERHLAFRNYLRVHESDLKAYGDLKEKLAKMFPNDIGSYISGKEKKVQEIEERALIWYKTQRVN
ncbi:GrpB-like predicted nucleotidyltransferase (UPF0157 family) [Priestia megaterium]|uniref:GrpB family protein n=1 Tax=Priestia megaterium TaxID=1404 RepID=UPI00257038DE|nr:GrpB family protein [Priestia megaterium]WJD83305.1 GrpB family protein [Priestia megaterium]